VPPGASLGRHRHGDDTEWYLLLEGTGMMHVEGKDHRVTGGDFVVNRPFGEHGLVNDSERDLHVMVFKVGPGSARSANASSGR
jgi:quercetin dioxygenase-like cupin family protein